MCRTTPSAADGCDSWAFCRRSSVHCGRSATRSAVPSASEPYAPYDISTDPAAFDLVADRVGARVGKMLVLRRPAPSGETATLFLHGVGARWTTWTPLLRAG